MKSPITSVFQCFRFSASSRARTLFQLSAFSVSAFVLLTLVPGAWAANGNDTWQGGASGTSTNFSVSGNWTSGSANQPPISGDLLFFGAAGANGTNLYCDQSGFTYAGITFNAGASAFSIRGNSFTLSGGGITNNAANAQTISNAITVTGVSAIFSTGGNLNLYGAITGSGTITNNTTSSASTLFWGDISGFTGTFGYADNGTDSSHGNNLRFTGTTAASQDGENAVFSLSGSIAKNRELAVGNTGIPFKMGELNGTGGSIRGFVANVTLMVGYKNTDSSFSGIIDNTQTNLALTKVGSGKLTLSGANSYSGGTTIQNGAIILAGGNNRLTNSSSVTLGAALTSGVLQLGDSSGAVNQTLAGLATTGSGGSVVGGNASVSVLTLNLTNTNTFGGTLGGAGANQNNLALTKTNTGTLILSGANTFSGGVNISNGVINVNGTETPGTSGPLGSAGTISFGGGTLQYSSADSADYSSRFSTIGGQAFNVDVNGQSVTFASAINNAGGTLTVTDSAPSTTSMLTLSGGYNCPVTVSSGRLTVLSSQTSTANVSVSDGGKLRVTVSGTSQWSPNAITLGTSAGGTLEFNGIANTSSAPLNPTTVTVNGTTTVNVNSGTGLVVGGVYPLVSNWGSGSYNLVAQPPGVQGGLSVSSGTLVYTVTAVSDIWNASSPGGNWDIASTTDWTGNAVNNPTPNTYQDGDAVAFNDSVTGPNTVTVAAVVAPSSIAVGNSSTAYTIASSGGNYIGGSGALSKSGTASLTLTGANSYSGGTTLSAGQLNINNGGDATHSAIGTGPLTISGGTIDNTSGSDETLQPNNSQNWNGDFTYAGSTHNLNLGTGAVTLNTNRQVAVSQNTLTVGGVIGGSFALTKAGSGTLVLSGANTYSSTNTVSAGTLKAGVASVAKYQRRLWE